MKAKTGNRLSSSIALDVLASMNDINVYDILKKEGRDQEITDLQNVLSKFDFDPRISPKRIKSNPTPVLKSDRSPYELPLAKFKLDPELLRDCKMKTPYRNTVREAMLTLETRIRDRLALADEIIGVHLVDEARNRGIFKRTVKAEEDGLYMLFRGAMLYFRNPSGQRKINYTKEDALKILLFSDYLIRLFTDLLKNT